MGGTLLMVNPRSRRGRQALDLARAHLHRLGCEPVVATPGSPEEMVATVRDMAARVERVLVAGGDGSLSAVLPALVETQLPLAVWPVGTANDLARTLGLPDRLSAVCALIRQDQLRRVDVGRVNGSLFLNAASIGLTPRVTRALTEGLKRRWGRLAYGVAAWRALREARPLEVDVEWAGGRLHLVTWQVVVANGRSYGGVLEVAEDATAEDRVLDLFSVESRTRWGIAGAWPSMRTGQPERSRQVRHLRVPRLRLTSEHPLTVSADGELRTRTPAELDVVPGAIAVYAPPRGDA